MQYIDCFIDPITRTVSYPAGTTIVQRDTNVEVLKFHYSLEAEHTLENDSIRIMVLKDGETHAFSAENVRIEANDGGDDELVFEHTITTLETVTPGQISVSVCGNQVSGGIVTEAWHTLNMTFQVTGAAHTDSDEGEDTPETMASNAEKIAALQVMVDAISSGNPVPVESASMMEDESVIYLYTGNEEGYSPYYWYYYDYEQENFVPGSRYGGPSDERVETFVHEWLEEHPEATTTVQDGSLTEAKFSSALKLKTIKDYVTPEMFGAVGDGLTDDTNAFQQATDSGFTVVLTKQYLISNELRIKSDVIGINESKVLIRNNIWLDTDGITLNNIVFDGNNDCGIVRIYNNDITVKNCKFYNFGDISENNKCCALVVGERNTIHVTNANVLNCYFDGLQPNHTTGGIRQIIVDRADCNIENCYFKNLNDFAEGDNVFVYAEHETSNLEYPYTGAGYKSLYCHVKISNNTFILSNKSAIKIQASGPIINNNTFIINSSANDVMHSAIRAMGSENVIICGNVIKHISGNINFIITAEYCNSCMVANNEIASDQPGIANVFRNINNLNLKENANVCRVKSNVTFFYGCNNDGLFCDNIYDININGEYTVKLFDESHGIATQSGGNVLIIKNNTFCCRGTITQFLYIFRNSLNIEIGDNTIIGTFSHDYACAEYRGTISSNLFNSIYIGNEKSPGPISVYISIDNDARTNLIDAKLSNLNISNLRVNNCRSLTINNCKIERASTCPINFYSSSPDVIVDGCDLTNLYSGWLFAIRTENLAPTFDIRNSTFDDIDPSHISAYTPSSGSYSLSNIRWRKNNATGLINVDYAQSSSDIIGFTFESGAHCYDYTQDKILTYYNGAWV